MLYKIVGDFPGIIFFNITQNGEVHIRNSLKSDGEESQFYTVSISGCRISVDWSLVYHELFFILYRILLSKVCYELHIGHSIEYFSYILA